MGSPPKSRTKEQPSPFLESILPLLSIVLTCAVSKLLLRKLIKTKDLIFAPELRQQSVGNLHPIPFWSNVNKGSANRAASKLSHYLAKVFFARRISLTFDGRLASLVESEQYSRQ